MTNGWLRFALALIAITAIAAAGFRVFQVEQALTSQTRALIAGADAADTAIETVAELRAALHAYVAPGQAHAFWTSRAAASLDKLRGVLVELDQVTSTIDAPLSATLNLVDRLASAEQRAREYARANQPLLAGDVIFADARDQLDAIRLQVAAARGRIGEAADADYAAARRQQVLLAAGMTAMVTVILLALVPPVAKPVEAVSKNGESAAGVADLSNVEEYARVIPTSRPGPAATIAAVPKPPAATPAVRPATTTPPRPVTAPAAPSPSRGLRDGIVSAEVMAARSAAGLDPSHRVPDTSARTAPTPVDRSTPSAATAEGWREAAALCSDLARVSDSQEISALLARAATLLNASGIIVWMAADGGDELAPAASTGYDDRLIARLGRIPRQADNLTAAAYRDRAARTSAARDDSAAALAVPLLTPAGPVGVLSAEIRAGAPVDVQRQALATILSAQLSMLLGAPAADARQAGEGGTDQVSGTGQAGG